jgi:hypothetical protein
MRRYVLPLLLFGAIGVVIVVLVKSTGDDPDSPNRDEPKKTAKKTEKTEPRTYLAGGGRNTKTPLKKNRWMSELERVLDRDDLSNAYVYRQKIAEQMTEILGDKTLWRTLVETIRKYAIEERDPEKRKLLLPLLRVLTTPEATAIIEQEYYRTDDPEERMVLLAAMAHPEHKPETASVWSVETALNSENSEHRHLAFQFIADLDHNHAELVVGTATQIYVSSTRPAQRKRVLESVTIRSLESKEAQKFIREQLRDPRESEVMNLIDRMEGWGTLDDAAYLESLATRFPALSPTLRQRADKIRTFHNPELRKEMERAEKLRQKEREEREKEEREKEERG